MNPVEQLLADLQAGSIETPEALAERLAALSDAELAEFESAALAIFDEIVAGNAEVEGDRIEVLETLTTSVEATRTEAERRYEAAEAEQARIDELAQRAHPVAETDPEAEPEPAAQPEGEGDMPAEPADEPAQPDSGAAEPQPEPVAASLPRIGRVAVRRPAERAPQPRSSDEQPVLSIVAAAEVPGYAAGARIPDMESVVAALSARAEGVRGLNVAEGTEQRYHVATLSWEYPSERDLRGIRRDPQAVDLAVTAAIGRRGERHGNRGALTAAGGFCAPPMPVYDQITIGSTARPARDALPGFGAGRGRVTYMPSPVFTDYASGVRRWTGTNDTEALTNSDVRKPCVRVDCDDPVTAEVYAIPVCITVGNFFDRTYDERRSAILEDVMVWQARFAERHLLTLIGGASLQVTAGQTLGTTRDVLAHLDLAVARFRGQWRVDDNFRLEYWAPRWLRDNMRADLVRALPVSGASLEENLAVADGQIEAFFDRRNVNVTWLMDGEDGGTDQEFGVQISGPLVNWPTRVISYLFHPGAHRFLDGGELNLGIVRDSTLNATNDLNIWSETFEGIMSPGLESVRLDFDICPTGEISGTVDVTGAICTTGS